MFKLFTAAAVVLLVLVMLPLGALMIAPVLVLAPLALLPLLGLALGVAMLVGVLRLVGVVLAGAFSIIFAVVGFALMLAVGAVVFGLAIGLLHLLLPILLLGAIGWAIHRAMQPNTPRTLPPAAAV